MQVYANDLNPRSHYYLDINVVLNKVPLLASPVSGWHHTLTSEGFGALHIITRGVLLSIPASEQLAEG